MSVFQRWRGSGRAAAPAPQRSDASRPTCSPPRHLPLVPFFRNLSRRLAHAQQGWHQKDVHFDLAKRLNPEKRSRGGGVATSDSSAEPERRRAPAVQRGAQARGDEAGRHQRPKRDRRRHEPLRRRAANPASRTCWRRVILLQQEFTPAHVEALAAYGAGSSDAPLRAKFGALYARFTETPTNWHQAGSELHCRLSSSWCTCSRGAAPDAVPAAAADRALRQSSTARAATPPTGASEPSSSAAVSLS